MRKGSEMHFHQLFENKELHHVKEQVGVISVESLIRQWDVVAELPGNRLVAKHKTDGAVLMGVMGVREDDKRCVQVEVRGWVQNQQFTGCEFWHVASVDQMGRRNQMLTALRITHLV